MKGRADDRNVVLNLAAGDLTKSIVVTWNRKMPSLPHCKVDWMERRNPGGGKGKCYLWSCYSRAISKLDTWRFWLGQIIMGDKGRNQNAMNLLQELTWIELYGSFYISKSEEYDKRRREKSSSEAVNWKESWRCIRQEEAFYCWLRMNIPWTVKDKQITVELNSNFDFDVKCRR